jgi:hypothetical protein
VAGRVNIDFDILSASGPIGALQLAVDYSEAAGEVVGTGGDVDCTSHVPGTVVSFNDDEANETLRMGFVSLQGIVAPVRVATCRFVYSQSAPQQQDFVIDVEDASDPDFNPIEVNVEPEVLPAPPTTIVSTTTSSSTTTLPTPDPFLYTVYVDVESATDEIGAIQLDLGYAGSPGEFVGTHANVDCRSRVGSHRAYNDDEATSTLSLGFVSLNGFSAPISLVRCRYRSLEEAPVPGDFTITITDASTPDFEEIDVTLKVRVSDEP